MRRERSLGTLAAEILKTNGGEAQPMVIWQGPIYTDTGEIEIEATIYCVYPEGDDELVEWVGKGFTHKFGSPGKGIYGTNVGTIEITSVKYAPQGVVEIEFKGKSLPRGLLAFAMGID